MNTLVSDAAVCRTAGPAHSVAAVQSRLELDSHGVVVLAESDVRSLSSCG